MSDEYILAIDNGTQSVRAMIFDVHGNLIAKSRVEINDYQTPQPGLVEIDPMIFWNSICQACRQLWTIIEFPISAIKAVALTTQRSTVINLDKFGQPLRPAIVWLDQRRTEGLKPVQGFWGVAFALSGMKETVAYLQAEAEGNWIRTNQPEIWKNTYKYVFLSGYLTYKLSNEFKDSIGCQVGYIPFDYKRQSWSGKWDWKWQAVPVEKSLLPDLVPPASQLGRISKEASLATGIPEGLPLIAAAADKACE